MSPSEPLDDERLIEIVLQALDAGDPLAALRMQLAGTPHELARGERLLQQYTRLAALDAVALVGSAELPPDPEDPAHWPVIPNVTLEGVLGRGGQGLVLRGRQTYLDRPVAVKLLAPELQTPAFLERFRREARLLARLRHSHIVACHDAGVATDGRCYLVMELVEGPNLAQHSARQGALGRATALRLVRELATALQHAAAAGLVHRDVKPENVLLAAEPDGGATGTHLRAKLADLGLARPMEQREGYTLLTPVGAVVGTPVTMAPEQFDGPERVDERADMYGLGCVLHLALTGAPAFRAGTLSEALVQKLALRDAGGALTLCGVREDDGTPTGAAEVAALGALVSRLLAWAPEQRPSTYDELLAALDARIAAPAVAAPAPRAPRRVRKAAAVVTGLALGYVLWRGPLTAPRAVQPPQQQAEQPAEHSAAAAVAAPEQPPQRPSASAPRVRSALFPVEDVLADWTVADPRPFALDESRRGALVNAARTTALATRPLSAAPFTLSGTIEARARYVSPERPQVPVAEVRARLALGTGDAVSVVLAAQEDALELRWLRETYDGATWREAAALGAVQTLADVPALVSIWVDWDGTQLRLAAAPGATTGDATAASAVPLEVTPEGAPRALELTVRGGVAVFTDWFVEIAQAR